MGNNLQPERTYSLKASVTFTRWLFQPSRARLNSVLLYSEQVLPNVGAYQESGERPKVSQ